MDVSDIHSRMTRANSDQCRLERKFERRETDFFAERNGDKSSQNCFEIVFSYGALCSGDVRGVNGKEQINTQYMYTSEMQRDREPRKW